MTTSPSTLLCAALHVARVRTTRSAFLHPSCRSFSSSPAIASWQSDALGHRIRDARKIVVMVGAGMSVAAGIADFRTPGTGLYDNLDKYRLPYPEAVFDLEFFRRDPEPFYMLCKELWPGKFKPTMAHHFVTLLHEKGRLQRCYTQNIDSLETLAGLPTEAVVPAHGNFDSASCIDTNQSVPVEEMREAIFGAPDAWKDLRRRYGDLAKPDIVFFGEALPDRFYELSHKDLRACDCLLILGTSLQVYPFASLAEIVRPGTPRVLVNREKVGRNVGLQFDIEGSTDLFIDGDCDEGVRQLAQLFGFPEELEEFHKRHLARLEDADPSSSSSSSSE